MAKHTHKVKALSDMPTPEDMGVALPVKDYARNDFVFGSYMPEPRRRKRKTRVYQDLVQIRRH